MFSRKIFPSLLTFSSVKSKNQFLSIYLAILDDLRSVVTWTVHVDTDFVFSDQVDRFLIVLTSLGVLTTIGDSLLHRVT